MDTRTNQLSQANTNQGFALYVHLHPAYYGLVVYDQKQHRIHRIITKVHHNARPAESTSGIESLDSKSLSEWIESLKDIFTAPYDDIKVCVSTSMFQLINDEQLATPANFAIMNKFEEGQVVILKTRIHNDLFVQFGVPKNLYGLLSSHFEPSAIHFGDRGLLQLLSIESDLVGDGVYCQLLGQDATVAVIKSSKLIFFNKYPVKDREDLLYYILLCFQSHNLDAEKDSLYLSGLVEAASPMYELVYDYVRNVEWMSLPGEVVLPKNDPDQQEISLHYFINLLSIR